jgi:hypothetical protein
MSNMSYCRFRNTLNDLRDCYHNFDSINSDEELRAAKQLLALCQDIVDEIDPELLEEQVEVEDEDEDEDF